MKQMSGRKESFFYNQFRGVWRVGYTDGVFVPLSGDGSSSQRSIRIHVGMKDQKNASDDGE